jgi:hypothetical protein
MLAANGLVEESFETERFRQMSISHANSSSQAQQVLRDFVRQLERPSARSFKLSELGRDFLRFVGSRNENLVSC